MKVVATYSIKGGVGKTSAAVNLAALAAREGLRTVLWDLDPQGAATFLFRIEPKVKGGGSKLIRGQARAAGRDEGHRRRGPRPAPGRLLLPPPRHRSSTSARSRCRGVARVLAPARGRTTTSRSSTARRRSRSSRRACSPPPTCCSCRSCRRRWRCARSSSCATFLAGVPEPAPEVLAFFSMVDRRKQPAQGARRRRSPASPRAAIPSASQVELMGAAARAARRHRSAQPGRARLRGAVGGAARRAQGLTTRRRPNARRKAPSDDPALEAPDREPVVAAQPQRAARGARLTSRASITRLVRARGRAAAAQPRASEVAAAGDACRRAPACPCAGGGRSARSASTSRGA